MALEKKIPHIPILCKKRKRRFLRVFHFLGAVGQKERRHIWKRFHKRFHTTTQPPSNSQTPCNKTLHHLRGEKKEKICHLFWSLMVILFLSCRNLPRQCRTRQRVQSYCSFTFNNVKGLFEQLRRCLQRQGVRAVFKSETTLRFQLARPKDAVDPA